MPTGYQVVSLCNEWDGCENQGYYKIKMVAGEFDSSGDLYIMDESDCLDGLCEEYEEIMFSDDCP